jgi:hypothetical protein
MIFFVGSYISTFLSILFLRSIQYIIFALTILKDNDLLYNLNANAEQ